MNWIRLVGQLALLSAPGFLANNMSNAASISSKYLLYVGTYAKGIYAFRYDAGNASLEPLSQVGELASPSWITTDPHHKHLYAVSELDGDHKGAVAAFSIDHASGKLTLINSRSSEGLAPCHLSVDRTGKVLVTANYTSGSVASYLLGTDGSIGELASLMSATGTGPNKERQTGPHAHEVTFSADNRLLYVPDLGLDQIRIYKFDTATAELSPAHPSHVEEDPGMGPRHIVFGHDGKFAYVMNELKPAVTVFARNSSDGALTHLQTISSVPEGQTNDTAPAEILIDKAGKHVYASNRGPGTIAVMSVDHASGKLTLDQIVETGSTQPRGVNFDPTGKLLFVGDQKTDKLITFHIDPANGRLTPTGHSYETPSPVAFVFVPVP